MDFIDFDSEGRKAGKLYGGNAGRKLAYVAHDRLWMVKFPQRTRDMAGKALPPYTSSPLSEYLGSRIYAALGLPVHETVLGRVGPKLVVACGDFSAAGNLVEFSLVKNSVAEETIGGSYGSSARGERLSDVLTVIAQAEAFAGMREQVERRFWDMFVVDALILNGDRNNGNWGLLVQPYGIAGLAPVYDNGNAFFNKRADGTIESRLADGAVRQDLDAAVSFFLDDADAHIHPFELMARHEYPGLDTALERFAERFELERVLQVVRDVPGEVAGIEVISPARKQLYTRLLTLAAQERILPCLR